MTLKKIRSQMTKDYVVHPLLSGPSALPTLTANATANLVRNLWTHSVIMCGHFPEGVETFERRSIDGETRGEWYLRQMLGSANITGSQGHALHDRQPVASRSSTTCSPTCRATATPRSPRRCRRSSTKYGLTYTTGSLPAPGRLGVEEGHPALAAQRLRRQGAGHGALPRALAGSPRSTYGGVGGRLTRRM